MFRFIVLCLLLLASCLNCQTNDVIIDTSDSKAVSPWIILTDTDADPFNTGVNSGAIFAVNIDLQIVIPLVSDPQWQTPMHVVQGGPIWWVLDMLSGKIYQWHTSVIGQPATTTVAYDPGLIGSNRWFLTSDNVPLISDGWAGVVHQALPPPNLATFISGPQLVGPAALEEDANKELFVLDADADPLGWKPLGFGEGAVFRASDLATVVASPQTISPLDFLFLDDGRLLICDANSGLFNNGIPDGEIYIADTTLPWPVTTLSLLARGPFVDPTDVLYESPTSVLIVDMNSGDDFDGLASPPYSYPWGRGGIFRLNTETGAVQLVLESNLFVNPVRIQYLEIL